MKIGCYYYVQPPFDYFMRVLDLVPDKKEKFITWVKEEIILTRHGGNIGLIIQCVSEDVFDNMTKLVEQDEIKFIPKSKLEQLSLFDVEEYEEPLEDEEFVNSVYDETKETFIQTILDF